MKKKLLSLIVCAALVFSLAGCNKDQTAATTAGSASESTDAGKETEVSRRRINRRRRMRGKPQRLPLDLIRNSRPWDLWGMTENT